MSTPLDKPMGSQEGSNQTKLAEVKTAVGFNAAGTWALFIKEIRRFLKVFLQTILTPMVTVLLYLLVFAHVLEGRYSPLEGVGYTAFMVPGLMMMSVIQNAFANSSSSLMQAKINGSLTFLLLAPLSAFEIWLAFVAAAVLRGLLVGLGVWLLAELLIDLPLANAGIVLLFAVLGGAVLGVLGMIGGIVSEKFDHLAAFQNFVILPLSFLSGVFYSIHSLPEFWAAVSRLNPFFYMIDGVRHGFIGTSDVSVALSLTVVTVFLALVSLLSMWMLHSGWRIRD